MYKQLRIYQGLDHLFIFLLTLIQRTLGKIDAKTYNKDFIIHDNIVIFVKN